MMYVSEMIMLYILNLYSAVCQHYTVQWQTTRITQWYIIAARRAVCLCLLCHKPGVYSVM